MGPFGRCPVLRGSPRSCPLPRALPLGSAVGDCGAPRRTARPVPVRCREGGQRTAVQSAAPRPCLSRQRGRSCAVSEGRNGRGHRFCVRPRRARPPCLHPFRVWHTCRIHVPTFVAPACRMHVPLLYRQHVACMRPLHRSCMHPVLLHCAHVACIPCPATSLVTACIPPAKRETDPCVPAAGKQVSTVLRGHACGPGPVAVAAQRASRTPNPITDGGPSSSRSRGSPTGPMPRPQTTPHALPRHKPHAPPHNLTPCPRPRPHTPASATLNTARASVCRAPQALRASSHGAALSLLFGRAPRPNGLG